MFRCLLNGKLLILFCVVDFDHLHLFGMFFLILFQNFHDLCLLIISEDQVNRVVFFEFFCVCLCIASGSYHDRIRVHFFCLVQHLSGFTVCNIRNRTGIDQIYVRSFRKRYDLISCFFQKLLHCFYFVCIYFTAQIMKGNLFFHIF